ncbi:hypothetical protein TI05_07770 [Achromatium sp. WMS3]|nr:hypothetical protein TI05_07770 [Achromatium sp. WMS3]
MQMQQQSQSSNNHSSRLSWGRIAFILGVLGGGIGFTVQFLDLNLEKILNWCQHTCVKKPVDCNAPIFGSNDWQFCANQLAKAAFDPASFQVQIQRIPLLSVTYNAEGNQVGHYGPIQDIDSPTTIQIGDQYQIRLQPPVAMRMYMLYLDATGIITKMQQMPDGYVALAAQQKVVLPKPSQAYEVRPPSSGAEHIFILFVPDQPQPLLDVSIDNLTTTLNKKSASVHLAALFTKTLADRSIRFTFNIRPWQPTAMPLTTNLEE